MSKKIHKEIDYHFGDQIKLLRQTRGMTQIDLGKKIGLSKRMIAYYEIQSTRLPKIEVIQKFANALNCQVEQLIKKNENPPEKVNSKLWKKLRQVEKLDSPDQEAVINIIEHLIKKQNP